MNKLEVDVTFIVVTRNEEKYIERCLRSILAQKLGSATSEIILIDGQSSDATVKKAVDILNRNSIPFKVFSNPRQTLASGWNIGIQNANGKFLLRPDAHAELHPEYTSTGLKTFDSVFPEPGVVGGRLETKADSWLGKIISAALSSRFGVGNSTFRTSDTPSFADTAVYGIYKSDVFSSCGYFDEVLTRHQDTAFHHKLKLNDVSIYFNPSMNAIYYCRETLEGIARQMYLNGYHLGDLILLGIPNAIKARHMAPFIFFSFIVSTTTVGLFIRESIVYLGGVFIFGAYFSSLIVNSIAICIKKIKLKYLFMAPVIVIMHLAYALGSFRGLLKSLAKSKNNDR